MTFEATITKLMLIMGAGYTDYDTIRKPFYTEINHDTLFAKGFDQNRA